MKWLLAFLLGVALAGCGGPATVARKTISGIDMVNAQAARLGRVVVKKCIDDAVKAEARAKLDECEKTRDKIAKGIRISIDATDLAASGVDIAEAAQSKDFSTVLGPALNAARALAALLSDAGVKLPPLLMAVLK